MLSVITILFWMCHLLAAFLWSCPRISMSQVSWCDLLPSPSTRASATGLPSLLSLPLIASVCLPLSTNSTLSHHLPSLPLLAHALSRPSSSMLPAPAGRRFVFLFYHSYVCNPGACLMCTITRTSMSFSPDHRISSPRACLVQVTFTPNTFLTLANFSLDGSELVGSNGKIL